MECFTLLLDYLVWIKHQFLSGIRDSRKAGSLWGMMRGVGGVRNLIQQSWLPKGLGLGLLCWGFKGVQEEIPWEEASTLQIGSVSFTPGQCTNPQLHPCHRLFEQDKTSRQFLSLPIVLTLLPVTFAYSLSSEAVVMKQLRRWKRLWQRSLTKGLRWGLPEVVGTVQQVYCSRRRLLQRGLEFHVYTINKSALTKKVWKFMILVSVFLNIIFGSSLFHHVNQFKFFYRLSKKLLKNWLIFLFCLAFFFVKYSKSLGVK